MTVLKGIEANLLPVCRQLGIGVTAYGVVSRGLLSGHWSAQRAGEADFRAASPRFQGDNLAAISPGSRRCERSRTKPASPSPNSPSPGCSTVATASWR